MLSFLSNNVAVKATRSCYKFTRRHIQLTNEDQESALNRSPHPYLSIHIHYINLFGALRRTEPNSTDRQADRAMVGSWYIIKVTVKLPLVL